MSEPSLPPARFEGVVIYPDPDRVFEVRYPMNWHRFEVTQQKGGVLFSPYPDHKAVWVAAWKDILPQTAQANDEELLRNSLDQGLKLLGENVNVEHQSEEVIGDLMRFERIVTFNQQQLALKRRHWLFYAGNYQINLLYQSVVDQYKHWSGMAYYSFHTFRLPEFLWFATDPQRGKPAAQQKGG